MANILGKMLVTGAGVIIGGRVFKKLKEVDYLNNHVFYYVGHADETGEHCVLYDGEDSLITASNFKIYPWSHQGFTGYIAYGDKKNQNLFENFCKSNNLPFALISKEELYMNLDVRVIVKSNA